MKRRLNLTSKMTIVFVSFAIFLLAGVGLLAYHSGRAALLNAVTSDLLSAATEKGEAINAWIGEEVLNITTFAASPKIRNGVQSFLSARQDSTGGRKTHDNMVAELLPWTGLGHSFLTLFVIEAESGKIVAATDENDEGKFRETHPYYLNGLHGPYIQNPVYELSLQSPAMYISAPIRSAAGDVLGVLAGRLNPNEMHTIVTRRTGTYRTYDAFLVNTSNLFVTQPRLAPDQAVLRLGIHTEAVTRCLAGNSGVLLANDYRGVPAVVAYRWLPERELGLIVKVDQVEAFAPTRAFGKTIMLLGGLALLFGLILSFVLARTITRPIRALQLGVERFGKGDLNLRLPETSGDEIGLLAKEFNLMAANLAEKESKLQLYNVQLEQTVERRTAELQRSEERFRLAAESSTDLIYEWNMKEHVDWFGKIDELLGYGSGEFPRTFEAWANSVHPDDRDRVMAAVNNHLERNDPYDVEYRVRKRDNTYHYWWARGMAVRDENSHPYRWVGAVTDVTERKRAEEELKKHREHLEKLVEEKTAEIKDSEGKFRQLYEGSRDGYVLVDMKGNIQEFNHAYQQMLGYSEEELHKLTYEDLTPAKWYEMEAQIVKEQIVPRGYSDIYEKEYMKKDRTVFPVELRTYLLRNKQGTPSGMWGFIRDITERKRAEDEIQKLNTKNEQRLVELTALNKELEAFSYSVSHDLRAPLRSIDGFSLALLEDYIDRLDETGKDYFRRIRSATQRMSELIDGLLILSRLTRAEMKWETVDLSDMAQHLSIELQDKQPDHPLEFVIVEGATTKGDAVMLRVVIENLLGNAWKFTRKHPTARIEFGMMEGDGQEPTDKRQTIFYVRDDGAGFDMAYSDKLFGAFQRLHSNVDFPGIGIGLTTVQRIIHRHGGRIWAEGELEKGATFYFTLP
jgi:PAS domain S-box-containing protein